jgi:rare lipoprotein A
MTEPRDDYYYEIQLTNKQLVFYFLAGATGLILSFLAGVMVGRGVDSPVGEAQAAKPIADERVVAEEPTPRPSATAAEELTYAQRLEADKVDDTLERRKPQGAESAVKSAASPAASRVAAVASASPNAQRVSSPPRGGATSSAPLPSASPAPSPMARATPSARPPGTGPATAPARPLSGNFSIQVGAFKERDAAESVVARLKKKGFAAFVVSSEGTVGLYNVRVGSFAARADAERVQAKLRDEEKFKPFIVTN